MIWLTGGTLLRLVAFAGMGAGVYYCFVDIRGEYLCDMSLEVLDTTGVETCLRTKTVVSKSKLTARAKEFAQERLRLITLANQQKLSAELNQQVAQMEIEKAVMETFLDEFVQDCKADTTSYVESRWKTMNQRYMTHSSKLSTDYNAVTAQATALAPYSNATDICHTAAWAATNTYKQCEKTNVTDDDVRTRTWVVSGVNGCSMDHSKLLHTNLQLLSADEKLDMCSKSTEWDLECGNEWFANDHSCYCVKRLHTCFENQNASFSGEVFEKKASLMYSSGGACLYAGGMYSGSGVVTEAEGSASNLACQYACVRSAGCSKWQRNANTKVCQLVYAPGSPTAVWSDTSSGYTVGDALCGFCEDDGVSLSSVCRSKGVVVDLRCGWKLNCEDSETLAYCGIYYPDYCAQVTTTTTATTTTTTAHAYCTFTGDVTFNIRLDADYVEHDGEGSIAGAEDNRFGPEFGTIYGSEVNTFLFSVTTSRGGSQTAVALSNWATGDVLGTAMESSSVTVDCSALGGCGYTGQASFACAGRQVDYDLSKCRTTASLREACHEQRLTNITGQKTAAIQNLTSHWSMQNMSFEDHLVKAAATIDSSMNTSLPTMFRIDYTKAAVADLDANIVEFSNTVKKVIDMEFSEEYLVDVGERYRIGCAHRDSSFNWGMGPDATPVNSSYKAYVERSGDLGGSSGGNFLLHPCTVEAEAVGNCSHNTSAHRPDLSKLFGYGTNPLEPPMKMPALKDRQEYQRVGCLEMPCLVHPDRHTCLGQVAGTSVRLRSPTGLYLSYTNEVPADDMPTLSSTASTMTVWLIQKVSDKIRLVADETGEVLTLSSDGDLSMETLDTSNKGQLWNMADGGGGQVYLRNELADYFLAEFPTGVEEDIGSDDTTITTTNMADAYSFFSCGMGVDYCLGTSMKLDASTNAFLVLDAVTAASVCESVDTGDRYGGLGWTSLCDQGQVNLTTTLAWELYAYDATTKTSSLVPMETTMSCTAAYDRLASKWAAWQKSTGEEVFARMEDKAYQAQFDIMQDTWQQWKAWEEEQSIYLGEKVEVSECVSSPNEIRIVTSGFTAIGARSDDCRMAGCDSAQCVVKRTKCSLGESLNEVSYECQDRIEYSKKALDELLMGIFGFLLSFVVFVASKCTDDPGRNGIRAATRPNQVVPEPHDEEVNLVDQRARLTSALNWGGPRGAGNATGSSRSRKTPMIVGEEGGISERDEERENSKHK